MMQIVSTLFQAEGVGCSMIGGRPENQDDMGYAETPLGLLLVVCDGMGGGPGGKTASSLVRHHVLSAVSQCSPQVSPVDALKMATDRAQVALEEEMQHQPQLRGMGSTLVALLIGEQQATVAHLGDSRCYRLSQGRVVFRTKDHSLVGELVQTGALTEEEARLSSQSNVITRALGSTSNHVAEIEQTAYRQGDRFVLCTDGVWGVIPHADLQARLCRQADIPTLVSSLSTEIDKIGASHNGHYDNHTLVVIEVKRNSILQDKMKKKTKILLAVLCALLAASLCYNIAGFYKKHEMVQMQNMLDELDRANQSLEQQNQGQLQRIEQLQHDITDLQLVASDQSVLQQKYNELLRHRDSLRVQNNTLSYQLWELQQQLDQQRAASQHKPQQQAAAPKKNVTAKTSKEAYHLALNNLDALSRIAKKKELNDATREAKKYVETAKKAIVELDRLTGGKHRSYLQNILNELQSSDLFDPSKNVDHDKDGYKIKKDTAKRSASIIMSMKTNIKLK